MKYLALLLLISCRVSGTLKDSLYVIPTEFGKILCERQHSQKEFLDCYLKTTGEKIASVQIGENTNVIELHKEDL